MCVFVGLVQPPAEPAMGNTLSETDREANQGPVLLESVPMLHQLLAQIFQCSADKFISGLT